MMFRDYIAEGIEDRGILKAVFVVGIPGAGKSYTVSRLKGTISPVVVNTDKATEWLAKKLGISAKPENWPMLRDSAHRLTRSQLELAVTGMLPLFVDGTSSDASNILHRAGILESLGYDIGIVVIDTDIELAMKRVQDREEKTGRGVSPSFVKKVSDQAADNHSYFEGKFEFFKRIRNDGALDDAALQKLFTQVQGFYTQPVNNPVGKRAITTLQAEKAKLLVPVVISKESLRKRLESWYRT